MTLEQKSVKDGKKPKLFMVGLGGTIAAKEVNHVWKSGYYTPQKLINMDPKIEQEFDVENANLLRIHSADTQPSDWVTLAELVYSKLSAGFDGIVVTHGTDTMHYTASALSFLIQNIPIPIVFTGSQIIPTKIGSDSQRNIYDSLRVASFADLAEVVIVFNGKIFRANRTRKIKAADFDAYRSSAVEPLGFVQHEIVLEGQQKKRSKKSPKFFPKLEENVFLLEVYPGLNPKVFEKILDSDVKGVVIEGYGLGNYPVGKNSLTPAINRLAESGIPTVLTTQCSMGSDWKKVFFEEIGNRYDPAKIIFGYDLRPHTALVKLMWILAQTNSMPKIRKMIHTNYAGEITPGLEP